MQMQELMEDLRRRIADPGFYRRMALRTVYDQPPEVLQARQEAHARVLARYLASLPNS